MKRSTALLVSAIAGLTLLAGCTAGPGASSSATSGAANTIKIGVNYELSGAAAASGAASVKGIQMAVDEVNAAGGVKGKKIQLVSYDTASDPAEATKTATKLITQDKVVTVIGPTASDAFLAEIPVATANKIPVVSSSATADGVLTGTGGVQAFAFRTCFTDSAQGEAMATFASQNLTGKSAVIIKDASSSQDKALADAFKKAFTSGGGTITEEATYSAQNTDLASALARIKTEKHDVIYLPGSSAQAGLIIKQARALGLTSPVLGGLGLSDPKLLALAGAPAMNNVYLTNHFSSLDQDPPTVKFAADFHAKNGVDPDAFNALGYDAALFVADAISRAATIDGPGIQAAMTSTQNLAGVTGTLSMEANNSPAKTIIITGLKEGVPSTSVRITP